jgi:hypothetical protein
MEGFRDITLDWVHAPVVTLDNYNGVTGKFEGYHLLKESVI